MSTQQINGSQISSNSISGVHITSNSISGVHIVPSAISSNFWHGIVSRTLVPGPLPTFITSTTFTLSASGVNSMSYYFNGQRVDINAVKTTILSDGTAGLYYIYFDGITGNILNSKNFPGLTTSSNVLIASVFWNGTNYGLVQDERHIYNRDLNWHSWTHNTLKARYGTGLSLTTTGSGSTSTFSLTSGNIYDEDINFAIPTTTQCRIFYQNSASSYTFLSTLSTVPFKNSGNAPQFVQSDAGTPYSLVNGSGATIYYNFFFYVTTDLSCPVYCFVETKAGSNGYTSVANARAIPFPNLYNMGFSPELKAIYRIIVSGTGVIQTITTADDYRDSSQVPSGGVGTISANSVSFAPGGNLSATNVQSALDELDLEKIGTSGAQTFTGAQRSTVITLTDASTITPDFSLGNLYQLVLGGNRTIAKPINLAEGQQGTIKVIQDISGNRSLTWGGSTGFPFEWYGGIAMNLSPDPLSVDQAVYSVDIYKTSTVTMTIANPAVITWSSVLPLYRGQRVQFTTTGALPTGISINTNYWITPTGGGNDFYISTSLANCKTSTYVTTSGTQSGSHTCIACSITMSINNGFV